MRNPFIMGFKLMLNITRQRQTCILWCPWPTDEGATANNMIWLDTRQRDGPWADTVLTGNPLVMGKLMLNITMRATNRVAVCTGLGRSHNTLPATVQRTHSCIVLHTSSSGVARICQGSGVGYHHKQRLKRGLGPPSEAREQGPASGA